MGLKEIKEHITGKSKGSQKKITFQHIIAAENLIHNTKRAALYGEMNPNSVELVAIDEQRNQFEERTVAERKAELEKYVNDTMRSFDDNTLDSVMTAISDIRANDAKILEAGTGNGFEQYTVDACDTLYGIHKEILKEKETNLEK